MRQTPVHCDPSLSDQQLEIILQSMELELSQKDARGSRLFDELQALQPTACSENIDILLQNDPVFARKMEKLERLSQEMERLERAIGEVKEELSKRLRT